MTEIQVLVPLVIWFGTGVSVVTVSSARVKLALNGCLEKPGEGKQEVSVSIGRMTSSPYWLEALPVGTVKSTAVFFFLLL